MPNQSVVVNTDGWKTMSLPDCIERVKVPSKIPKKQYLEEGTYPVISQEATQISGYWNNSEDVFSVDKPLVIFGDHTCNVKFVDFNFVVGADGVKILKPKEFLDGKFFFYQLLSFNLQSTGYARHFRKLKEYIIAIPPLEEQQRIVSILDEAFENISNSSKRVEQKLLDSNELLQSITHSIITLEDHSYDEYALEELTHKITKGSSPKWQGVSYIDEPGVLFVTSENVGRNQMIYKKTKFVEDKFNEIDSKSILQKGDVLTNIVGASIGRTAVFDKDDNSNINQAVCLIRCNEEKLVNKYLAYLLNSHFFVQILHDNEVNTARANLSLGFFRSLIIPVPTISEQYEIIEKLDSVYSNISKVELTLEQESRSLNELRRSILQEAFNGTL